MPNDCVPIDGQPPGIAYLTQKLLARGDAAFR